jgi:hypothetical protein
MTRPVSLFPPASYSCYQVCTWGSLLARWLDFSQVGLEPSLTGTACPPTLCSVDYRYTPDSCALWTIAIPLTLTHWTTLTNFQSFISFPMFRIYLGTTNTWLARPLILPSEFAPLISPAKMPPRPANKSASRFDRLASPAHFRST